MHKTGDTREVVFKIIRIIGDILFINLAFYLAFLMRFLGDIPQNNLQAYIKVAPYISLFSVVLLQLYNLYSNPLKKHFSEIAYTFIPTSAIIVVFSTALTYFMHSFGFPRSVFLLALPIMVPLMIGWRYSILKLEKNFSDPQGIVVIGSLEEIEKLIKNIKRSTNGGYLVKGIIVEEENDCKKVSFDTEGLSVFYGLDNLRDKLRKLNPDVIFVAHGLAEETKKSIIYLSLDENWKVSLVPDFYEIMLAGATIENIGEIPIFAMKSFQVDQQAVLKRVTDIVLSLFGLIVSLPLTIIVAILIKLDSPGPVFFTQKRVSRKGKVFKVYKFRTMVNNAEAKTGPVLASKNDSRVTRIGNILRKTRIDEIPQLINVLKGDMSLIGPRPERPHFVEQFEKEIPDYKYRHQIKSGITGLAQVYGYYSTDPSDKLRMDLLYANKKSFMFDLKIILQTIKVMFMKDKAS